MTDLGFGRGWASPEAAASIWRIDAALGHAMQITEAGRSAADADRNYARYQAYLNGTGPWAPIAYPSWMSVHCWGNAIDSDEAQRFIALMARHGWRRTVYRNGKLEEPWHFEYFIDEDQHRFDGIPAGSGGEEIMPTAEEIARATWHGIKFKSGRTSAQVLVDTNYAVTKLLMQSGTGRFFKHGDMPKGGSSLWVYVLESGDFVRIRDLDTAKLYKEINGQASTDVSGAALRLHIGNLIEAGGRDLTAVTGTTDTVPTPVGETDIPDGSEE